MRILSPSLLSADFYNIRPQMELLNSLGIKDLHVDVMDGAFVPSISFGMPVIFAIKEGMLKSGMDIKFDVHLMVNEPVRYVREIRKSGADNITIHAECTTHIDSCINLIKEMGASAGISLNPATSLSVLENILPTLDLVLIMGVNPGFGGQKYIPYITEKIKKLAKIRKERNLNFTIQVDGGVNFNTIETVLQAGAENIVAGSAVFTGDIRENIIRLNDIIKKYN